MIFCPSLLFNVEQKYNIETKVYAMDFTKGAEKDYQALQQLLAPVEVTVLGKTPERALTGLYRVRSARAEAKLIILYV